MHAALDVQVSRSRERSNQQVVASEYGSHCCLGSKKAGLPCMLLLLLTLLLIHCAATAVVVQLTCKVAFHVVPFNPTWFLSAA
jgi:hypothetical protein